MSSRPRVCIFLLSVASAEEWEKCVREEADYPPLYSGKGTGATSGQVVLLAAFRHFALPFCHAGSCHLPQG